ncbi:MAG: caspase family protein, partial [Phaeodactylibacter sp.]|nr:caspase family protein [Phaeodactylibacter sp.]
MAKPKNKDKRSAGFSSEEEDSQPVGKSWFFGIGINDYQHFPPLNNAVRDVESILQLLREQYDIDEAKILTDGQATRRS